ncbi:hypothetical protein Q5530_30355 [Saccharothrix sp. BKS2]|uniref:hypothetical protein n=1 Tax=Saccharothrix sp. BKS2 TaxID=3064400 RepID=UPI0039EBAE13
MRSNGARATRSCAGRVRRGPLHRALALAALLVVVAASGSPLYWSVAVASHDNAAISGRVPPLLPGGEFARNAREVFEAVDFWPALRNSALVACTVTASNGLLSTLAGFAFAHLPFRGRDALFAVVVGSVLVPVQLTGAVLGTLPVVPLFVPTAGRIVGGVVRGAVNG